MAANTWGYLPKTIDDSQTIAEYIAAQFAIHNADDSAHGQSNEAVYNHRIAEILDHLDASIIAAKIQEAAVQIEKTEIDKPHIQPSFETTTPWTLSKSAECTITLQAGTAKFTLPATDEKFVQLYIDNDSFPVNFNLLNPIVEFLFFVSDGDYSTILIGLGSQSDCFIGFKIINNVIYAAKYKNGTQYTTEIVDVSPAEQHHYVAKMTSGSKIEYYIDDVLVHTYTTNLPTDTAESETLQIVGETTANDACEFIVSNMRYQQDKE